MGPAQSHSWIIFCLSPLPYPPSFSCGFCILQLLKLHFPATKGLSSHWLFISVFMLAPKIICDGPGTSLPLVRLRKFHNPLPPLSCPHPSISDPPSIATQCVKIPPMVGPPWSRVAYIIRIGLSHCYLTGLVSALCTGLHVLSPTAIGPH